MPYQIVVIKIATGFFAWATRFFDSPTFLIEFPTSVAREDGSTAQDYQLKQLHMPMLVLSGGPAVFGFEATGEIGLGGESDGSRRLPNRSSGQQVLQGQGRKTCLIER